jgi:hypothetical protein
VDEKAPMFYDSKMAAISASEGEPVPKKLQRNQLLA